MAEVLALIDDLFFHAKVQETARQLGVGLRICTTPEALLAEIAKEAPKLVLVDLNARSNSVGMIEQLQANDSAIPVTAFLSHVQTELAARARAAGCREVMPRSQFTRDLATILSRAKSQPS
jgi:DNA-binding NarL/FixJ family response regulator